MSHKLRRLHKLSELFPRQQPPQADQRCLICMEPPRNSPCGLLDCGHNQFCFTCIETWSQITNKCPLCNLRFYSIKNLHTHEKSVIPDKDQVFSYEDHYREIRCRVCHSLEQEEIMLLCDNCDAGYHTTCIGLIAIPNLDEWFCEDCLRRKSVEKRVKQIKEMEKCKKAEGDDKEMPEPAKKRKLRSCREVRIPAEKPRRSLRARKSVYQTEE
ncbi:unnamed protein product [Blepharisma stoltei]|uniref:PHD and RING finger domain-containing protein 1 n=1 Tax=Blepharisma stoltei TaxID=1481888 RepID=A0AAU9K868_9CILI|nr:unnamed protein product [Blepharisma stoltei]